VAVMRPSPRCVLVGAIVGFIRCLTTKNADNPLTERSRPLAKGMPLCRPRPAGSGIKLGEAKKGGNLRTSGIHNENSGVFRGGRTGAAQFDTLSRFWTA
jgi:hypothetical protein